MRPAISCYGMANRSNSIEEIQCEKMEFGSDADANKFARKVMGHNCFAIQLDDTEVQQYKQLVNQFIKI